MNIQDRETVILGAVKEFTLSKYRKQAQDEIERWEGRISRALFKISEKREKEMGAIPQAGNEDAAEELNKILPTKRVLTKDPWLPYDAIK